MTNYSLRPNRVNDIKLTERETETLALAALGLSDQAIGRELFLSSRTVSYHLFNAYQKLGAGNRIQAVRIARRHGLIPPDSFLEAEAADGMHAAFRF